MGKRLLAAILGVVVVVAVVAMVVVSLQPGGSPNVAPGEVQAIRGHVVMRLNGEVVRDFDNLIVDSGFDAICASLGDSSVSRPAAFDYIAVGIDGTAPASGNTGLGGQLMRKKATYAHTIGTKVWTLEVTFAPGDATGAIQESGVFNAAAAGTMLSRQTFAVVNKAASDTLVVTWTFTLSQG